MIFCHTLSGFTVRAITHDTAAIQYRDLHTDSRVRHIPMDRGEREIPYGKFVQQEDGMAVLAQSWPSWNRGVKTHQTFSLFSVSYSTFHGSRRMAGYRHRRGRRTISSGTTDTPTWADGELTHLGGIMRSGSTLRSQICLSASSALTRLLGSSSSMTSNRSRADEGILQCTYSLSNSRHHT